MTRVLDLDADEPVETLRLAALGDVPVHSIRGEHRLRLALHNPVRASPVSVVNELLALSTHLPREQLRRASMRSRHRLAVSVARANGWEREWKALYGSHLSHNERLVATAVCGRHRQREEMWARLRANHARLAAAPKSSFPTVPAVAPPGVVRAAAAASESARGFMGLAAGRGMPLGIHRAVSEATFGFGQQLRFNGLIPSHVQTMLAGQTGGMLDKVRLSSDYLAAIKPPLVAGGVVDAASRAAHLGVVKSSFANMPKLACPAFVVDTVKLNPGFLAGLGRHQLPGGALSIAAGHPAHMGAIQSVLRWQQNPAGVVIASGIQKQLAEAVRLTAFRGQFDGMLRPVFDIVSGLQNAFGPLDRLREELAEAGRFLEMWEDDPLWFLISLLGTGASRKLVGLNRQQVETVLLHALEKVVREGAYVAALREVIAEADDLTEAEQEHLDHALEHAQRGEWRHALASFHPGFEGALWQAGLRRNLVVARRGKFQAAEKLVKVVVASEKDYVLFVVRRVYGGEGNAHRHGRASVGEREVMLLGVVALAGWMDHFMGLRAMDALVDELEANLARAIEAAHEPLALEPVTT